MFLWNNGCDVIDPVNAVDVDDRGRGRRGGDGGDANDSNNGITVTSKQQIAFVSFPQFGSDFQKFQLGF